MKITKFTQTLEKFAVNIKPIFWLTTLYYKSVVKREITLANIGANDHVLFIGGGECPFSAIMLHQITGAKVTVIDCCENCVAGARLAIKKLNLCDHINVLCMDGANLKLCELCLQNFTVIHFALQVSPIDNVLAHVKKHAAPGTKFLVRKPKRFLQKMYCKQHAHQHGCDPLFAQCKHITHTAACNIGCTMLYVKDHTAAA